MPKNAASFFDPTSDYEFEDAHPFGYKVLCLVGITAVMLPVFLWLLYTSRINPAPNSAWLILGFIGAFIFGIGLFNVVAAFIKQYLGHFVTIACFIIGALLITISTIILY